MNFLNLTSFLKIRPSEFSKPTEGPVTEHAQTQQTAERDFWKHKLSGELPVMEWPASRVRIPLQQADRKTHSFVIQSGLKEKIYAYATQHQAEVTTFLIAALRVLLYRYSGQTDLIIANAVYPHSRSSKQVSENKTIQVLPMRIQVGGEQFFKDTLEHTSQEVAEVYTHRNIPYKQIVGHIHPGSGKAAGSIFQVLFHFKESDTAISFKQPGIIEELQAHEISDPDLITVFSVQAGVLFCHFHYESRLLNTDTIQRMATHFEFLLQGIVDNEGVPVALLPLLSPDEIYQQVVSFNQPDLDYTPEAIHHLFEQQVNHTPDAIAVVFDGQHLTYQQLNSKANQLAHRLQKLGVGPEVIVGLCLKRSPQFLIGLMAVLKAGGAFMPLDPGLPSERLSFMLEDAQPALILTQEGLAGLPVIAPDIRLIYIDHEWPWIAQESTANIHLKTEAHQLMYVIYTSGSSGKPKGVLIEHASLFGFLKAYEKVISLTPQDRVLQFVPVVFDPMVEDIFCTFYKGATLVLRTEEMADSAEVFFEKCKQWGVTMLNLPAAFWHMLVTELTACNELQLPETIRIVKVGGERLLAEKVYAWQQKAGKFPRLLNAYGPTEATIAATLYDCQDFPAEKAEVPIGLRLSNLKLYVLDTHFQPVPVGVPGELFIGGNALARGYLKRNDLSAQKFISDPFSTEPGARLYRTGDLVRYLPDGKLEYQDRIDSQVKIRGFRIELGEIESVLGQHPQVKQVVVVVREDVSGDKRLIAYLVPESRESDTTILRHYLQEHLPDYMIPSAFVCLEKLPYTFNGKVDRNALPVPDHSTRLTAYNRAPETKEEKILADIWKTILNIKEVGVQDHFFETGGYSLLAARLIAEIKRSFNTKLPLSWVFAHPTISEQARYLAAAPDPDLWDNLINIRLGGTKAPVYMIHDSFGGVEYGFQIAQYMDRERPVYGFQAVGLNGVDAPIEGVKNIATYYIKRLLTHQPEGIYHLAAYSGGATIAFEMACQLKAAGKQVGMLTIFDSYPANLSRFTYQRIGILYIMRSIWNLVFSPEIPLGQRIKMIIYAIPEIIGNNWQRIRLRTKEKTGNPVISASERIFRVMRKTNDSYRFRPYAGSMIFIRAIENPARYLRNSDFGWSRFAREVKVFDLPGTHKALFQSKENLKKMAEILDTYLSADENK